MQSRGAYSQPRAITTGFDVFSPTFGFTSPSSGSHPREDSVAFTRSGVNGTSRSRAPVASKIALPICGNQCDRRFSRAGRLRFWAVDQNALDDRYLDSKRQRVVTLPVDRGHLTVVPGDFLSERATHSLQHSALDLITQALRVGNRSTIMGDHKSAGLHPPARLINFHFGDKRSVPVVALVRNASDPASGDGTGAHSAGFGRGTTSQFAVFAAAFTTSMIRVSLRCCNR